MSRRDRIEGALRRARAVLPRVGALVPALGATAFALGELYAAHRTFFSPAVTMNAKDEGYITAFAFRMLDGHWLPYVDAVSHRGPFLYWLAAIAVALGGRESFAPIRTLALLGSLLMVVLAFAASARARRPLAGAIAAVAIAVCLLLEMPVDDGLAYNGEPVLDVLALGGLLCLAIGLDPARARPGLRWVAAAGVLGALGALSKQVGAVTLVAFAAWPLAASFARPGEATGWRRLRPFLWFAAGGLGPPLLVLARYAVAGQLRTLFFYSVTYNSRFYMAPITPADGLHRVREFMAAHALYVVVGAVLVAWGLVRGLSGERGAGFWRRVDQRGFLVVVSLTAALSALAADGTARHFPHYFVQVVPWFALLLGLAIEESLTASDERGLLGTALVHLGVLAPAVLVLAPLFSPKLEELREARSSRTGTLPICTYVRQHSGGDEPIYVWGFAADIYTYCHRKPASRFVYSTFQSGFVPFFDSPRDVERARVVPGSPELFLADLEQSRARLVIDVPGTLSGRSIEWNPLYATYLRDHYCPPVPYDGARVFARREPGTECPGP